MGGYMARTGHIPIDRSNARAAVASMNEAARLLQGSGTSVLIYPEGTRSMDGRLQEFKDGAAMLAIKSGLPVLPCAVVDTDRVLPSKGVVIRPHAVELRVGEPVDPAGHTRASLTDLLRERVAALATVKV
jgi:1-acyl-sn-glycerol-3-phosphate acyltransferase